MRRGRKNADVGGDPGQQHVARNQHAEGFAVERDVLRRVAVADDHPPRPAADLEGVAVDEALIGGGQRRHAAGVGVAAARERGGAVVVEAVVAEMGDHRGDVVAGELVPQGVAAQVFALGHHHAGAGLVGQPLGEAQVIRVAVGDDDLRHRFAEAGEDGFPGVAGGVEGVAGIDDRHAFAVLDQPQVDVVEGEGQRHADPRYAGGDLAGLAGLRHAVEGVFEGRGAHCCCSPGNPSAALSGFRKSDLLIR